jgi:hypothetical protein
MYWAITLKSAFLISRRPMNFGLTGAWLPLNDSLALLARASAKVSMGVPFLLACC